MYDVIICIDAIENRIKIFFRELTADSILFCKAFEECKMKTSIQQIKHDTHYFRE